jgi:hypothetical protein
MEFNTLCSVKDASSTQPTFDGSCVNFFFSLAQRQEKLDGRGTSNEMGNRTGAYRILVGETCGKETTLKT